MDGNNVELIDALKNGMSPEEVQYLFNDIEKKANTRIGKRILRLFIRGIVKAKQHVKKQQMAMSQRQQNMESRHYSYQNQQSIQPIQPGYQYKYFRRPID